MTIAARTWPAASVYIAVIAASCTTLSSSLDRACPSGSRSGRFGRSSG